MQKARKPQQARSREALKRIYRAVNSLLEESSFDRLSMSEIAHASDVSVGSIYQRFSSKNDLLLDLYGSYIQDAVTAVDDLVSSEPPASKEAAVGAVIDMVCALFGSHRGVVRSFLLKYRQAPEGVPENYHAQIIAVYDIMDRYFQDCGATSDEARVCRSLIMAGCREHLLFGAFDGLGQSDNSFRPMLTRAALSVMTQRPGHYG